MEFDYPGPCRIFGARRGLRRKLLQGLKVMAEFGSVLATLIARLRRSLPVELAARRVFEDAQARGAHAAPLPRARAITAPNFTVGNG